MNLSIIFWSTDESDKKNSLNFHLFMEKQSIILNCWYKKMQE